MRGLGIVVTRLPYHLPVRLLHYRVQTVKVVQSTKARRLAEFFDVYGVDLWCDDIMVL